MTLEKKLNWTINKILDDLYKHNHLEKLEYYVKQLSKQGYDVEKYKEMLEGAKK